MKEYSTSITLVFFYVTLVLLMININEQIKVDLIFIYSITQISTAFMTEYLNKLSTCFVYTVLICNKAYS